MDSASGQWGPIKFYHFKTHVLGKKKGSGPPPPTAGPTHVDTFMKMDATAKVLCAVLIQLQIPAVDMVGALLK